MRNKPINPVFDKERARGVLLCCPLYEKGTIAFDLSIYKRNGDLNAGATNCTRQIGENGRSVLSDAITDRVSFGDSSFLPTSGNISVCVLFSKTDGINRTAALFGIDGTLTQRMQCHCPWSDGTVYFDFGGTVNGTTRVQKTGLSFGHVLWVFTVGARGMEIWRDGKLEASHSNQPTRTSTTTALQLGVGVSTSADFVNYDHIEIHNRQLEPEEIWQKSRDSFELVRMQDSVFSHTLPPIPRAFVRDVVSIRRKEASKAFVGTEKRIVAVRRTHSVGVEIS